MKLNKIFISGLAMLSLTACNDYLEVEPATNVASTDVVFASEGEIQTALYGVYAKLCSDNLFGNQLYNTFMLNSDVDFYANANEAATGNQPRRFDVRSDASNVESLWNNLYSAVETANEFIYNLRTSKLYAEETQDGASEMPDGTVVTIQVPKVTALTQMMGEAKVMRAMFYHELLSYWGDIPFTLKATYESDNLVPPITDRKVVSDSLIADLIHAAEYMESDYTMSNERISKEAAYAMIARLALQAGGYSLNHDAGNDKSYFMSRPSNYMEYYVIARNYTKKIIDDSDHSLGKTYREVFIDECNFVPPTSSDDVIFEIPFARGNNSYWGYNQGPTNGVDTGDATDYTNSVWGATSGGVRTSHFYRYSFDERDLRRDFVTGFWYYSNQGLPTMRLDYAMHNNKWSKLWNSNGLGKSTTSGTGINFAYFRYADVLLMFAEAENEISGPTSEAQEALKTVRRRAFLGSDQAEMVDEYVAEAAGSKESFLNAVLDERKWEFAGENMRWKDLVRNNKYAEKVFFTFLDYYAITEAMAGTSSYLDMVEEYDKVPYSEVFVQEMYSFLTKNYKEPNFPNSGLYMFYIVNPYDGRIPNPTGVSVSKYVDDNELDVEPVSARTITGMSSSSNTIGWTVTTLSWSNDDGSPKGQVVYSLYGYIRIDQAGNIVVVDNGTAQRFSVNPDNAQDNINRLPPVRYLLPIPEEAIARSAGAYKNYYGY